ncbi:hypothetical protein L1049_015092 [Liquidambar formosana]|uniref:DUF4220 domain-containing protein n=1 Tax=Liquidambar formosana TaxID=63359 RepID=A0AAP0WZH1_LIQFO
MFIAGIIKYGERTWVLRSASSGHFRDSLLPRPNPGLDYVEIIEKYGDILPGLNFAGYERCKFDPKIISDDEILDVARYFFRIFRRIYANLIFSFVEIQDSYGFFSELIEAKQAFKIIELELGFLYDVLFTKASFVYSFMGIFLRSISFISIVSAFVGFLIINKHGHSRVDLIISYVLVTGAIALEIYAVTLLLSSDWTMLWLNKHKSRLPNPIYQAVSSLRLAINGKKRWSRSIALFNLIDFCLRDKHTKFSRIRDLFSIYEKLEKYLHISPVDFSTDLQKYIFKLIIENCKNAEESPDQLTKMCSWRGEEVLRKFRTYETLGWSVEVDFDESILLWHIATDLFYSNHKDAIPESKIAGKVLSDYMMYLLVMRPFMLPKGIGQIRFQDTVAAVRRVFQDSGLPSNSDEARKILPKVDIRFGELVIKGNACQSVLFEGCRLFELLESLKTEHGQESGWKWEMISNVWVEMLCYAANQCGWNHHAQRLGRGGELLTHVSLLMAHLGLTENLKSKRGAIQPL